MAKFLKLIVPDLSPTSIEKFRGSRRSLEICIDNRTLESLSFIESFYSTGGMFPINERPHDVVHCSGSVYYVANTSFVAGVSGGWKFKVVGKDIYLFIGFSNPLFGSYKTFVSLTTQEERGAKWPWDMLRDSSIKTLNCGEYIVEVTLTYPHYSPYKRIHCKIYYKENIHCVSTSGQ